ncbi:MAG TPA: hypothetical protein VFZ68_09105 [Acidimicrobiales bacterium]
MADRLHTGVAPTVPVRGQAARRAMRRSFEEFILGSLGPSGRGEIEIEGGRVGWWRMRRRLRRRYGVVASRTGPSNWALSGEVSITRRFAL